MTDDNAIKTQLLENITFLSGLFSGYCLDAENRQLFGYGMNILKMYISGTLVETEGKKLENLDMEELMRSYS
jgi:hypothetical protein